MNIIGISAHYHDAACCLLIDGQLDCAAEEERFTRRKHDPSFPSHAFRFCLEHSGLTISDIDCVAFYEDPAKKTARQIWMAMRSEASPDLKRRVAARLQQLERFQEELFSYGYQGPIEYVDHHLAHAASSFYYSGFEDAAILTVDGVGEWATTTYGRGSAENIEIFEQVDFPHSLGLLYSAITTYLGFSANNDEYKVMGLAPYGKPIFKEQIQHLIVNEENGAYRLNLEYFDFLKRDCMYSCELVNLFDQPPREKESPLNQFHKDLARSLQLVLEEILISKAHYLRERVPSDNLCMAGGVALNCVANGRVLEQGPFKQLFVQPAASDAGGCLGAAAIAHARKSNNPPRKVKLSEVYLGPKYSTRDVENLIRPTNLTPSVRAQSESELLDETVKRLAAGRIIGWFSGRMEFGPRALGSRSILADPRVHDMRDRINALVKKREGFRPFAPAVLSEEASLHFDIDHESPFMLETCKVISPLGLPAITHVDGSARVQTVSAQHSPVFQGLLKRFFEHTGCPILLNTSFNVRGEPIVCTPFDAIVCFVRAKLDCLVIENLVFDRESVPELWDDIVAAMQVGAGQSVERNVYTML